MDRVCDPTQPGKVLRLLLTAGGYSDLVSGMQWLSFSVWSLVGIPRYAAPWSVGGQTEIQSNITGMEFRVLEPPRSTCRDNLPAATRPDQSRPASALRATASTLTLLAAASDHRLVPLRTRFHPSYVSSVIPPLPFRFAMASKAMWEVDPETRSKVMTAHLSSLPASLSHTPFRQQPPPWSTIN